MSGEMEVNNGWHQWSNHVRLELERQDRADLALLEKIERLSREIVEANAKIAQLQETACWLKEESKTNRNQDIDIAGLKVKLSIFWGAVGVAVSLLGVLIKNWVSGGG